MAIQIICEFNKKYADLLQKIYYKLSLNAKTNAILITH